VLFQGFELDGLAFLCNYSCSFIVFFMGLRVLATSCLLALSTPAFGEKMPDVQAKSPDAVWQDLKQKSTICSGGMCEIANPEVPNGKTVILVRDSQHGEVESDRSKLQIVTNELGIKVIGVEGLSDEGRLLNGEVELVKELQADPTLTVVPLEDTEAQKRGLLFLAAIIEGQRLMYDSILQGCIAKDDRIENCTDRQCDDVVARFPDILEKLRGQVQAQLDLYDDVTIDQAFSVAEMDGSLRIKPDSKSYCGWRSSLVQMSIRSGTRSAPYKRVVQSDRETAAVSRIEKTINDRGLNVMAILFGANHENGLVKLLTEAGYTVISF